MHTIILVICLKLQFPSKNLIITFEASDELKVKKLTVLTWDEKREVKKDGMTVKFEPLWEWLLEPVNKVITK